jgi:hypothetical protein
MGPTGSNQAFRIGRKWYYCKLNNLTGMAGVVNNFDGFVGSFKSRQPEKKVSNPPFSP